MEVTNRIEWLTTEFPSTTFEQKEYSENDSSVEWGVEFDTGSIKGAIVYNGSLFELSTENQIRIFETKEGLKDFFENLT